MCLFLLHRPQWDKGPLAPVANRQDYTSLRHFGETWSPLIQLVSTDPEPESNVWVLIGRLMMRMLRLTPFHTNSAGRTQGSAQSETAYQRVQPLHPMMYGCDCDNTVTHLTCVIMLMLIVRWFLTRSPAFHRRSCSVTVLDQDYPVDLALNLKINKHLNNNESEFVLLAPQHQTSLYK